jgi:hypothetical protein
MFHLGNRKPKRLFSDASTVHIIFISHPLMTQQPERQTKIGLETIRDE